MTALRTLIAALALTLTASAFAQEAAKPPLATVYGTLNVNWQYVEASDANTTLGEEDVAARTGISIDSSNVGVRGGADVAHGLKVIFQCETQASVDGLDNRPICNRNSRLGVAGGWGTLFYGNWDTPYKAATYGTKADDPFGNTDVFGFQGVFGSPGFGVRSTVFNGNANAGFDVRAANSVAYWSPKIGPASFKVQYGTNEERSANGTVDGQLLSGVVNVDIAGLSVVGTAEFHEDLFGLRAISGENAGTSAAKDFAWKLAAGYELPLGVGALTVMGMLEQLNYAQDDAAGVDDLEDYSRLAWLLGAKFRTGNHELRARYTQALSPDCTFGDGSDCPDALTDELGAQQVGLGYAYHLAKSTQVYAFYTQIMNDDFAQYTFGVGGPARVVGGNTPVGSDPMAIGLGMRYAF